MLLEKVKSEINTTVEEVLAKSVQIVTSIAEIASYTISYWIVLSVPPYGKQEAGDLVLILKEVPSKLITLYPIDYMYRQLLTKAL
jgi:hypothetical protein